MTHPPHDPAGCRAMFEKLSEYLDNELDEITCADIRRHAESCVACAGCLETLRRTVEICKASQEIPVPETLSRRLREIIENLG